MTRNGAIYLIKKYLEDEASNFKIELIDGGIYLVKLYLLKMIIYEKYFIEIYQGEEVRRIYYKNINDIDI